MGLLDGPLRQAAATVYSKLGTDLVLRRQVTGVFDAATDAVDHTPIDYPLRGAITDYDARAIHGVVQVGDKKVEVPAAALARFTAAMPDTTWQVVHGGQVYSVVHVAMIRGSDQAVLYRLTARSG